MLLSHLLAGEGIESVVVETRSEEYVASRIRAGILEQSTVDLLRDPSGSATGWTTKATSTAASTSSSPDERHHLDFLDLTDSSVTIYGQTEIDKDLIAARARPRGSTSSSRSRHNAVRHRQRSSTRHLHRRRREREVEVVADVIAGCDGSSGRPGAPIPENVRQSWERVYPYSWLGILADVAPSTDELIYAWHPDGFALHSMRSDRSRAATCRSPTGRRSRSGPTTGSGRRSRPGSATGRTAGPSRRAGHQPRRAADAVVRGHPDAPRPAVPRRRRRAHRAAHRRQGPQPGGRRRRAASDCSTAWLLRRRLRPRGRLLGRRAAPGLAVHPLLLVDDLDAAHLGRPLRRRSSRCPSCGGSGRPTPAPPGSPRTTPACPSASEDSRIRWSRRAVRPVSRPR